MFGNQALYPKALRFFFTLECFPEIHPLLFCEFFEMVIQQNMQDCLADNLAFLISQNCQWRSVSLERVFSAGNNLDSFGQYFMGEKVRACDRFDESILACAQIAREVQVSRDGRPDAI